MEENNDARIYNTNDLKMADYNYQYTFVYFDNSGHNKVAVNGKRKGILIAEGETNIDLITGFKVPDKMIIHKRDFVVKNTKLSLESIKNIFGELEKQTGFLAYEYRYWRTINEGNGKLLSCVPYDVTFKASMIKCGLKNEFERNKIILENNDEPQCELEKLIKKVKTKFKIKQK